MFAPVVTRLDTYALPVAADTRAYMDAVLGLASFAAWKSAALWPSPGPTSEDEVDEVPLVDLRQKGLSVRAPTEGPTHERDEHPLSGSDARRAGPPATRWPWWWTTSPACWRGSPGLFSGRGYNIESLTVSETEHEKHVSRINIVTTGTNAILQQIKAQLERLVPVHRVVDLTVQGNSVERELALVKVAGRGELRVEAMRLASAFGARTVDATLTSFVFELTGTTEEIERFIGLMVVVGLVEVSRTGVAAMSRGDVAM